MATVEDVLDRVKGLRHDAAARVRERFSTVAELADASREQLTEITGIGAVMADRIRTVAAQHLPRSARDTTARAAAGAERAIGRTADEARRAADQARRAVDDVEARAHTSVHRLHARGDRAVDESRSVVDRVLTAVTAPARWLLDELLRRRR